VLHNLVGNALKFTSQGGVVLSTRVEPLGQGRERLTFSVKDTGRGMSPEESQRLFTPFSQLRAGDSVEGTGLGLALCRAIVEQMGGTLGLESERGRGSTFTVTLELPTAAFVEAPAAAVVNSINRRVAVGLLQRLGHQVDEAVDGEQALETLAANRYDLVFMDLLMPRLGGVEASRALRASNGPNQQTPVVALTASVLPQELALCNAAGMNDTLAKPLSLGALRGLLVKYLGAPRDPQPDELIVKCSP
jgi:hypothetical protein